MKAVCLTGARFNMVADVLHQANVSGDDPNLGHWEQSQDPLTGDIVRVWVPATPDDSGTQVDETTYDKVPCIVRGIVEGGVRAAGTVENWDEIYRSVELVRMHFPANFTITKRDRIFNIRNNKGQVLWKEEETGKAGVYKSTVFEVIGVTPIPGPFGEHIENYALLERADVQ